MSELYPPLLVVVPIVAAIVPLIAGMRFARSGWPVAVVAMAVQSAIAVLLLRAVALEGTVVHELGGFPAPVGIELVVDGLSAVIALLVAVVSLGTLAYARRAGPRSNRFYSLYLLLVTGLSGMSVTGDMFNLYVFLEITGLAAYGLVAADRSGAAAIAALKYLIVGTFGASLYLLGVGYAFVATGTLNMADFGRLLGTDLASTSPLALAAFGLIIAGLFVKTAIFPVHSWQPDAYAASHDTVSIYISALVSTVSAYAIARLLFSAFTVDFLAAVPVAQDLLLVVAGVSVVAGSVLAVLQRRVKRMLAYSSVSQFGLIVMAFAIANADAVTGGVIHLLGHAVMKGGLFAAVGLLGAYSVEDFDGLSDRRPIAAAAFAILAVSMIGLPPTVGFVGKVYIVLGALEAGSLFAVAVTLLSTLLTLMYFWRLIQRMYFHELPTPQVAGDAPESSVAVDGGDAATDEETSSLGMIAVVVVAAVVAVALGFAGPAIQQFLEPTLQTLLELSQ
jgi:multicomponent Na+:H+ antiporter subunit D